MSQNKLFRTRLFGYKKSDVNNYLLQNSEKTQAKLNEQYDKSDALVQENHALKEKINNLTAQVASLNEELSDFRTKKEVISSAILDAELRAADILKNAEQKKAKIDEEAEEKPKTEQVVRPQVRLKRAKGGF